MSDAKSAFMQSGNKEGTFLLDSLAFAFEDTRKGLSPDATARLDSMKAFVAANPEKTNAERFAQYVTKVTGATGSDTKPVATARAKPVTGTGML